MARSWFARALGLAFVLAACVSTGPPTQPTPSTATPQPSSPSTPTAPPTPSATPTAPSTPAPTATPTPTTTPSAIPGSGATFGLTNFTAEVVALEVVAFDADKNPKKMFTMELSEFDDLSYDGIPAGVYRMIFHGATPAPDDPTCDFAVADGDTYQFAVLPAGIVLARSSQPPATRADLFVTTSSLCHAQP